MHIVINLSSPNDVMQIVQYLPKKFALKDVAERLKEALSQDVRSILIEHPYVDKDYRSTYYNFYAKKGMSYDSFCARLHFFSHSVSLSNKLELVTEGSSVEDAYLGFMVLRPTEHNTIGRTAISPRCMKEFQGHVMVTSQVTHLLGYRLEVAAFPFMTQHTDVSVCAHVACWSILRYYSERFRRYAEFLTYDITHMANPDSPGGLIPSRGLEVPQAIQIFSKGGELS